MVVGDTVSRIESDVAAAKLVVSAALFAAALGMAATRRSRKATQLLKLSRIVIKSGESNSAR